MIRGGSARRAAPSGAPWWRLAILAALFLLPAAAPAEARVLTKTLPNGLTVILEHRAGAPVTAVQLWVRAGAADEEERTLGLAHYLEHMLFKGTATRPVGSIHEEVEKNGGEINAATSDDWTYYHVTIASSEWSRALGIITDIAVNASFPEEEFDREREVIVEELVRRDDNPMALLWDHLGRAAYARHPYRFRVIGTETSLAAITRERMIAFYKEHYVPGKMAVVVVGDLDTAAALAAIENSLGRVRGRPLPLVARVKEPARRTASRIEVTASAQRGYGAMALGAPPARAIEATAQGDVLAGLLAGEGIGRWTRRFVEEEKLLEMLSIYNATNRDPGLFSVFYSTDPARRAEAADEIRRALAGLRWEHFDVADVDAAARQILRDRAERLQTASGAAYEHGFWYAVGVPGGGDRYADEVARVTPDGIREFTRRHIVDVPPVLVALAPRTAGTEAAAAPIVDGIPLVHVATQEPLAAFGIFLEGGQASEPQPGWSAALAGVMNRGVEGRRFAEFARDMARLGVRLTASSAPDMIHVLATGPGERSAALVATSFEVVERPNMDDLAVVRKGLEDALAARVDDPFQFALDRVSALRFGEHGYGRPEAGSPEGLRALEGEALDRWRAEVAVRARARFVYVGPASETEVRAAVAARLASWPEGTSPARPPVVAATERAVAETAPTNQAIVMRSVEAPAAGDPAYPAWKLANAILGGRSSSRLFRIVREERGLAYAVGSFLPTRRERSQLVLYAGTRPANASAVRALWNEALADPTADELADAKRLVQGEFALDHEKVDRRAWYLGWYGALGLGASYDREYPAKLAAVTLEEVRSVFARVREAVVIDYVRGGAL